MPRAPLLLFVLLAAVPACRRGPAPGAGEVKPAAPVPPDGVRPLYAMLPDGGVPDPIAARLCDALQGIPARRRAACCNAAADPGAAARCTFLLASALRAQAVTLDEPAIAACAAAMEQVTAGCDFLAPGPMPAPEPCLGIVKGALGARSACRSSLECAEGLRCAIELNNDSGVCAAPRESGSACGESAAFAQDPLAELLRQDDLVVHHPECQGHCERQKCASPISPGGPCESTVQCDPQHHCNRQRCKAGRYAKAGEDCAGGPCAPGLRCLSKRCAPALAAGAACDSDLDCRGVCRRGDGGARGACAPDCAAR